MDKNEKEISYAIYHDSRNNRRIIRKKRSFVLIRRSKIINDTAYMYNKLCAIAEEQIHWVEIKSNDSDKI